MHSDKIIVILHLLHFYVFPPQLSHHSLAVIGALSPNAAIFPLFEMQTRWYALLMAGKCQLPSRGEMLKNIEETDEKHKETYYGSVRNALGVDWISYIDDIAKRIGVYPDFKKYLISDLPLFLKLVFGTALPCHYRLDGPHSWSGARNTIMESNMHSIRMMSKR
jgi:dimethylaniline monooxygenase (N-oxide forming)